MELLFIHPVACFKLKSLLEKAEHIDYLMGGNSRVLNPSDDLEMLESWGEEHGPEPCPWEPWNSRKETSFQPP